MSYPGALDSFINKVDNFDDVMASDINELQNSIMAMQSYFGTQIQFGWLPMPAGTYVSATSFTLTGDWTSFLKPGVKFKCTNSTGKYGTIESSSYAAGTGKTTVYLMGSISDALANAAISGVYISYATPPDFPALDPLASGWVPASHIWTYVSATSFKITGVDATAFFPVGTKLRFKQGGGWKYVYVIGVAFSTDTTVTVTGGSDYTIANAYLTDTFLSYAAGPQGFPAWFNWAPSFVGFSVTPPDGAYRFKIDGRTLTFIVRQPTVGTSNAVSFDISLPVVAATLTNALWMFPAALVDNGVTMTTYGRGVISSASNALIFGINPAVQYGFTASGGKRCSSCQGIYEI